MIPDIPADIAAKLVFGAGLLLYVALAAFVPSAIVAGRGKLLDAALVLLAFVSLLHYLQLPPFAAAADRPVHVHDLAHYWLGGKYFPETGYERMYVCFLEATDNDFGATVARDLRDKQLKPVQALRADAELECRSRFSPQRWSQYLRDVRTMRAWAPPRDWQKFVQDFGFNPPPTWLIAGYPLSNAIELTTRGLYLITLLDPLWLVLGLAVAGLAFGAVPTALAVLGITSLAGASAAWTIGSFLRWDWLFWLLLSVAAARVGRPMLSGAAFGLAAAIRIFPVSALVVLGLYAALRVRGRQPPTEALRFLAGLVGAVAGVVLLSLAIVDVAAWRGFVANLATLAQSYGVNFMGLRTALSFLWSLWTAGDWYPAETALVELKEQSWGHIAWLHAAISLGMLSLYRRSAALPFWVVLLAALAWIPFSWAEMASYYYMYWGALFLLARRRVGLALPLAFAGVASTALVPWLGRTPHLYAASSVVVCVAVLWLLALLDREAARAEPSAAVASQAGTAASAGRG